MKKLFVAALALIAIQFAMGNAAEARRHHHVYYNSGYYAPAYYNTGYGNGYGNGYGYGNRGWHQRHYNQQAYVYNHRHWD